VSVLPRVAPHPSWAYVHECLVAIAPGSVTSTASSAGYLLLSLFLIQSSAFHYASRIYPLPFATGEEQSAKGKEPGAITLVGKALLFDKTISHRPSR
jgi:hypothetical protein